LTKRRHRIAPGARAKFALVTYSGNLTGRMHGRLQLIVKKADSVPASVDIPYRARVIHGSLGYVRNRMRFLSTPGMVTMTMRSITLSNNFSVPILIYSAKIDDPSFQITHFKPNRLLAPGDMVSLLHVEFKSNGTSTALYTRDLELATNITTIRIPLQVYHGGLHCQLEENSSVDECSKRLCIWIWGLDG